MTRREHVLNQLLAEHGFALRKATDGDLFEMRWLERVQESLRFHVIMEGANVPCELVRDGGGA